MNRLRSQPTSDENRKRPLALPHDCAALLALAQQLRAWADATEDEAKMLREAAGDMAVKINLRVAVDDGLRSLAEMLAEAAKKRGRRQFVSMDDKALDQGRRFKNRVPPEPPARRR
jgi:hypothetical protein